jgi:1,4-alpha-glucan branching enzyme
MATVTFVYHTGLRRAAFGAAQLSGSWDASGAYASAWSSTPMQPFSDAAGCAAFSASVDFPDAAAGTTYRWGVAVDGPAGNGVWAIATEVSDPNASDRYRSFVLGAGSGTEEYWLSNERRFGAQKAYDGSGGAPALRFAVWAPNAQSVSVVFARAGDGSSGYIDDSGGGIDPQAPVVALAATGGGVWSNDGAAPSLAFAEYFQRQYMFRIVDEQGKTTYRTDLWSRNQAGHGAFDPGGAPYAGTAAGLDGTVSCSIVSDADLITADFNDTGLQKGTLIPDSEFWADEFSGAHPLPAGLDELAIYELHVGSLNVASTGPGDFADALAFVDALADLGVNAVELLPVLQFDGDLQWGYGSSHFFCVQSSAGGGNQLKYVIKACHQRGIAVILDVCYNHFLGQDGERAEWGYDSDPGVSPQHNTYYWYEGLPQNYADIDGGYVDNDSSGWAPRYWEENVRQVFASSALMLLEEYHADGLRVDLTDAFHQDNALHADGSPVPAANLFGAKLMRELVATARLVHPGAYLIAEDHTGWPAVTQSQAQGGIGFDAAWYADFYHHLIGDGNYGDSFARLLYQAGFGDSAPLEMDFFAGALLGSANAKVVYHECHDTAGNESGTERTIVTAVNGAPLVGATRQCAEARSRLCAGLSLFSAGTPMFLMGEEIGAAKPFRFNDFAANKEDLIGERTGDGRFLFRFYQDALALLKAHPSLRLGALAIAYVHDANRVIAFHRTANGGEETLVVASFNDAPFANGYVLSLDADPSVTGTWHEIFNSDASFYGGAGVGNAGGYLSVSGGCLNPVVPARGLLVFAKAG